jgi:hypothetical protein
MAGVDDFSPDVEGFVPRQGDRVVFALSGPAFSVPHSSGGRLGGRCGCRFARIGLNKVGAATQPKEERSLSE